MTSEIPRMDTSYFTTEVASPENPMSVSTHSNEMQSPLLPCESPEREISLDNPGAAAYDHEPMDNLQAVMHISDTETFINETIPDVTLPSPSDSNSDQDSLYGDDQTSIISATPRPEFNTEPTATSHVDGVVPYESISDGESELYEQPVDTHESPPIERPPERLTPAQVRDAILQAFSELRADRTDQGTDDN